MASSSTSAERSSSVRGSPGAMTMAMRAVSAMPSAPAHLRLGLVEDGRLLREEVLAPGGKLEGELAEVALHSAGRWHVRLSAGTKAKIASAAGTNELTAETDRLIALDDGARGKLVLGARTVLFQLVDAPAVRTRPQLPASVRAGLFHQIDAVFTAVVMGSFLVHFGLVSFLENADWPVPPALAALPPDAIEMLIQPLEPEPEAPIELPTDETEVADADPVPTDPSTPSTPSDPSPSRPHATDHASPDIDPSLVAMDAIASVDQLLIGALGEEGTFADVIAGGAAVGSAADVMATVDSVGVAMGGPPELSDHTGGTRVGVGDLGHLDGVGGHAGEIHPEGTEIHEDGPRGHFVPGTPDEPTGPGIFDVEILVREIRRRSAAITRCYEHELNEDPTLHGRVSMVMTVEMAGTLSHIHATENTTGSEAMATCITRAITPIRVRPAPTEGSVNVEFPFVFAPAGD